jgi:hypothetical protein
MMFVVPASAVKVRPSARFAPLKFVIFYLALTFALSIWGPIQYLSYPIGKTLLFMFFVVFFIALGYLIGVASRARVAHSYRPSDDLFIRRLLNISLVISVAALAMSILSSAISGQLNLSISEIGNAYLSGYKDYERNTGTYSANFILYSLSSPFNFIGLVLGLYYFRSLGGVRKILVLSLSIGSLLFYVLGSGKQKQLGDIVIILFAVAAVRYGVQRKPINLKRILAGGVVSVIAGLAFISVLGQRYASLDIDITNINTRASSRVLFDIDHLVFQLFGQNIGLSLAFFLSYLSQGYYGLGLALETDWSWTKFLGFSYSISVIASRLFGVEWEWPNNLLNQVGESTGWGASKWHTVFTHFATDFTFPGTVLIFGYFAFVYARAWKYAIRFENPLAILVFALLTMGVFFMPANNQLLHSPGGLFTVIVVATLYIFKGRRFNRPDRNVAAL